MTFDEILVQVVELLQREGRVSYRALKRRFALDDDYVEDLKDEIIKAKQLARDEEGAVLVWTGGSAPLAAAPAPPIASHPTPALGTGNPQPRTKATPARRPAKTAARERAKPQKP